MLMLGALAAIVVLYLRAEESPRAAGSRVRRIGHRLRRLLEGHLASVSCLAGAAGAAGGGTSGSTRLDPAPRCARNDPGRGGVRASAAGRGWPVWSCSHATCCSSRSSSCCSARSRPAADRSIDSRSRRGHPGVNSSRISVWAWVIGGCVAIRLAIPLAALIAEGTALPGMPRFRYGPLYGDANGYYAAAREIIAAALRVARQISVLGALGAGLLFVAVRRRASPALLAVAIAAVPAIAATLVLLEMKPAGAPVVGWPLRGNRSRSSSPSRSGIRA